MSTLRGLSCAVLVLACAPASNVPTPDATGTSGGASGSSGSSGEPIETSRAEDSTTALSGSTHVDADDTGASGSSGSPDEVDVPLAYLRAEPYARLVLEIDVVGGMEPYPTTTAGIVPVLHELVDKPGGIEVEMDDALIPVGSDHAWTADERVALGDRRFDLDVPADTIAIHVMFVDGRASEDDDQRGVTFGHAWGNRHVMIYKERIAAGCEAGLVGELAQVLCERTEQLLLQHELGHVLGLVDFGLPMQTDHRDPDHGPHDIDPACLMYWRYDGLDLVTAVLDEVVGGGPPVALDRACLHDIAVAQQ